MESVFQEANNTASMTFCFACCRRLCGGRDDIQSPGIADDRRAEEWASMTTRRGRTGDRSRTLVDQRRFHQITTDHQRTGSCHQLDRGTDGRSDGDTDRYRFSYCNKCIRNQGASTVGSIYVDMRLACPTSKDFPLSNVSIQRTTMNDVCT